MAPVTGVSEVFGDIFSALHEMWARLRLIALICALVAGGALFIAMCVWGYYQGSQWAEELYRIWPGVSQ